MNIPKVLEQLGFSPNEIKVYLTLNDHGSQKAGTVAKRAKIDRSSCYHSLKSLQEKGLTSYVMIGNTKWFQVSGPKQLLQYVKEQEDMVKKILPELQERHKAQKIEGQVRLFKGKKGIKAIFRDMIRTGKDNYVFGSEGQFTERMPIFAKQFLRMKKEVGMKSYMVSRQGRKDLDVDLKNHRSLEHLNESPAVTNIYGDKIAILIWTDEPEGIVIENAAAAKAYKSVFEHLWESAE